MTDERGAGERPEPIVRSGIDDPIGMRAEINAVRYGVYSWRYPILFLALAILFAAWIGPDNLIPYAFILCAATPLVWLPSTIRSRMLSRSVLRYAAGHDDPTADPDATPILRRGDWLRLLVVLAEVAVLVWLLRGGKA